MKFSSLLFILSVLFFSCSRANTETPSHNISDDSLLSLVQYHCFQYFWEGAEPTSGLARERYHVDGIYPENDKHIVTSGGSGFGLMAILVGIERGFISREEGVNRFQKQVEWLKKADRFHGAWPHWLNGETGKVKPFSKKDDGADLVETAYLVQGMITVREYFKNGNEQEKKLAMTIDSLWRDVDWNWFTQGGKNVIYWHWSPNYQWEMNFPVEGYNECLILYVLAASSPTHPVSSDTYHKGWARKGEMVTKHEKYGYALNLKHNYAPEYGGPLFWSHYSFLALNPKGLKDRYADYWQHNVNHTLINRAWCIENPKKFKGYGPDCWGLTASYSPHGYAAHAPGVDNDLGVISPTAAISSFPYTPEYSMQALKHFYYSLGDSIWGPYGFFDAFSIEKNWYPKRYLAIDQGPMVVMMENYRSGLLWNLFMNAPEIKAGLNSLGFSVK